MKSNRKNKKRLNIRWKVEKAKILKKVTNQIDKDADEKVLEYICRLEAKYGDYPVSKLVLFCKRKKNGKVDLKKIRYRAYFKI